jgi:hypothetical protein
MKKAIAAGLFLAITACADEPHATKYDFELETERLIIRGVDRHLEDMCAGTAVWTDQYVDSLAQYYGIPAGSIGLYYWYSQERFDKSAPNGACAGGKACQGFLGGVPTVFAADIPIEHEIVHVLQRHVSPKCVAMIEEGLAEFLRGPMDTASIPSSMDDLLDATFTGKKMTVSQYARARNFVSFLVHTYDLETVIDLCAAVPEGSSLEDFDIASTDLLGTTLAQLLEDYATYPVCDGLQDRAKIYECGRPVVAEVGTADVASFKVPASCASIEAVGPVDERFHISKQVRLLDEGYYSIDLIAMNAPSLHLRVEHCASCADDPEYKSPDSSIHWFLPGDYTLDISLPLNYDGELTVRLEGL